MFFLNNMFNFKAKSHVQTKDFLNLLLKIRGC